MGKGTVKGPRSSAKRCCGDAANNWSVLYILEYFARYK